MELGKTNGVAVGRDNNRVYPSPIVRKHGKRNLIILAILLILLPVAYAKITTITASTQNKYPGELIFIAINNNNPPTLILINSTQPCITQKRLFMNTTFYNLTSRINSSIAPGSYTCIFKLQYNGTAETTTTTIPSGSGGSSGGGDKTTTTRLTTSTIDPSTLQPPYPLPEGYIWPGTITTIGEELTIEDITPGKAASKIKISISILYDKIRLYWKTIVTVLAVILMAVLSIVYYFKRKPRKIFGLEPPVMDLDNI